MQIGSYADAKQGILGLGTQIMTFLDNGCNDRLCLQRQVSKAVRKAGFDLGRVVNVFHATWPESRKGRHQVKLNEELMIFRGQWRVSHLLLALARLGGVRDADLSVAPAGQAAVSAAS